MLDKMTNRLDFLGNALVLRAERQRAIASNIANADTPGYVARDFSFGDAMREATGLGSGATRLATGGSVGTTGNLGAKGATDPRHIPLPAASTGTGITRHAGLFRADPAQPGQQHGGPGPRARQLCRQRRAL